MNVQALVDMPDDEFDQVVSQAIKGRRDFPEWFRLITHPDVIDDTEDSIRRAMAKAERQASDGDRFPHAAGFVSKMRGVLAEVTPAKLTAGDT